VGVGVSSGGGGVVGVGSQGGTLNTSKNCSLKRRQRNLSKTKSRQEKQGATNHGNEEKIFFRKF
jgi:hypothetical protein